MTTTTTSRQVVAAAADDGGGRRARVARRPTRTQDAARAEGPERFTEFKARFDRMTDNIGRVIKGKEGVVRLALTAVLAQGHVLFEDLPGTGKTMLARSIAQTIDAEQSRVQCTPDLLPGDITGSAVLDRATGAFVFRPGPVFANIVLADEINRATPKTQSALLEAMQEKRVTYDGVTYDLPRPFSVLATQNPIEQAGTFPLPEAQLDRFMFKVSLGFLSREDDYDVLMVNRESEAIDSLTAVVTTADVVDMIGWANKVDIPEVCGLYIVDLVHATRAETSLLSGVSARASLSFLRAARVVAAADGRSEVSPDDVRMLARTVLSHRLALTPEAQLRDETVDNVVDRIVTRVKVPVGLGRRD